MVVRQAGSLSGGPHILWLLVGNKNSILQLFIHAYWYGEFVGEVLASKLEFVEEPSEYLIILYYLYKNGGLKEIFF